MSNVRAFRADDVPQVVALRQRSFGRSAHATVASLEQYFHELFFLSRWHDSELPSLVYTDRADRVVGFVGRLCRTMAFRGERLRMAVATQLCVDAEGSGLAALNLLRRFFAGPQDLTWTDAATDRVRLLWTRLGGDVARPQSLQWSTQVRPSRVALAGISGGWTARAMRASGRILLRAADAAVAARALALSSSLVAESPADVAILVNEGQQLAGPALRSGDAPADYEWTVAQVRRKLPEARLRSSLLRSTNGSLAGWYAYAGLTNGIAEVIDLGARDGMYENVLAHLVQDAWNEGLDLIRGRVEPDLLNVLGKFPSRLSRESPWALFHSKRRDVRDAIFVGDTRLSRLDGEWPLNF